MRNKIIPSTDINDDSEISLIKPKYQRKTNQVIPLRIKVDPDNSNAINFKHEPKKLSKHSKNKNNNLESHEKLSSMHVTFNNILAMNNIIECAVMKYHSAFHIWSSIKMNDIIIKDTQGSIKIKDFTDFTDKIINGDITIFDTLTGIMYNGIICLQNEKLHFKFANRPILPLCLAMNVILQFNIYLN